jgi:hypothetical protein
MSIEAMKQALKFCSDIGDLDGPYPYVNGTSIVSDSRKVLPVLRQAIAEAEKQEPYGYFRYDIKLDAWVQNKEGTQGVAFYTAPVHARPVVHAVRCTYPQCQATNGCVGVCSKGQPDLARVGEVGIWGDKREWVGLHEHELQVLEYNDPSGERLKLAKAVEAKLKEKNT